MSLSPGQDERSIERVDNNPRVGIQARSSITPMDATAKKERKIKEK